MSLVICTGLGFLTICLACVPALGLAFAGRAISKRFENDFACIEPTVNKVLGIMLFIFMCMLFIFMCMLFIFMCIALLILSHAVGCLIIHLTARY